MSVRKCVNAFRQCCDDDDAAAKGRDTPAKMTGQHCRPTMSKCQLKAHLFHHGGSRGVVCQLYRYRRRIVTVAFCAVYKYSYLLTYLSSGAVVTLSASSALTTKIILIELELCGSVLMMMMTMTMMIKQQ